MSDSVIQCPHCGQAMSAQVMPGQGVQCPHRRNIFAAPAASMPPVAGQAVSYSPPRYPVQRRGNALALIAMLCGFLFFVLAVGSAVLAAKRPPGAVTMVMAALTLLCPLLALILGIVGLARTRNPEIGGKGMAITGISLGGASLLILLVSLPFAIPAMWRGHEIADRVKCAANLKELGLALQLYSNENRGQFPPAPDGLLTQDIETAWFVCPSTEDTPAGGANAQQIAANLEAGGHDSYVYLAKGKNANVGPRVILIYEPMTNHKQGFNALFGDGHVEFISGAKAPQIQAELKAGLNPPPSYR